MNLDSIELDKYIEFACDHFKSTNKTITPEVVTAIYERFSGVTWYVQKVLNVLFTQTPTKGSCTMEMIDEAVVSIVDSFKFTYQEMIFRLPERQKDLLVAISKEGEAREITSGKFVRRYSLTSPSSVQAALKGLLEKGTKS